MESERVKNEIDRLLREENIDFQRLRKLKHWFVLALENDIANGSPELEQELYYAKNQDPLSTEKHGEIFTMSMAGMAAHEIARHTKEQAVRRAEALVKKARQEAFKFALKKEYEEAFLVQNRVSELEDDVTEKKERNEWCYFWDLVTCHFFSNQ